MILSQPRPWPGNAGPGELLPASVSVATERHLEVVRRSAPIPDIASLDSRREAPIADRPASAADPKAGDLAALDDDCEVYGVGELLVSLVASHALTWLPKSVSDVIELSANIFGVHALSVTQAVQLAP